MGALKVEALVKSMAGAASKSLGGRWPEAKDYATAEFRKIAQSVETVGRLRAEGKVTEEQARLLLDIQRNASRSVLLTLEGLGLLAAEAAINAALGAVRSTVNAALGWVLL
jgi:endonuclease III